MPQQLRPHASPELVEGYAFTAVLAERRQERVEAWGDRVEAKAWGKVAAYCRMMARCRFVDAPDSGVAYTPPSDETILNVKLLETVLARDQEEAGARWTTEKQMALVAAMHVLSSTERVVAEMHYGGLLSVGHIAQALDTTTGTVESYLGRIRKKWSRLRSEMDLTHTKSAG